MPDVTTGWMLAIDGQSVLAVGPDVEAEVKFAVGESASLELPSLVEELIELGALMPPGGEQSSLPGHSLAAAITRGWSTSSEPELIWTAEEAMLLPADIGVAERRAAIDAFIAGLYPDARLHAHARLLTGGGEVLGDRPSEDHLRAAVEQLPTGDEIVGCTLGRPDQVWRVRPDLISALDCNAAHRLGPIVRIAVSTSLAEAGLPEIEFTVAELREPDLAIPGTEMGRRVQGVGTDELGSLIARAEGAERLAARASGADGGSSGVAAHLDADAAKSSALAELIERDAFMWTWIQQLSRERIAPQSAPSEARRWSDALAAKGWACHWVNLTLESWPVILCCLVHEQLGLQLGAACRQDAKAALLRATQEALILALRFDRSDQPRPEPRDVVQPIDHLLLHRDPGLSEVTSVLYRSAELINLEEVHGKSDAIAGLDSIAVSPTFNDISVAASSPFTVIQAAAPGLLPLTFGFGNEPLGLALAGSPRLSTSGELVGSTLNTADLTFPIPHPFA